MSALPLAATLAALIGGEKVTTAAVATALKFGNEH